MDFVSRIRAYRPRSRAEEADRDMILHYIETFPDTILLRENKTCHMTASGFVVSPDGEQVLMAHHNIYQVWAWLGGHCDGEGDLLSVARREVEEESGVTGIRALSTDIASLEILPVWGHVKRGQYVPSHLHLNVSFLFTADPASPLRNREGENSAVGWLPAEGLYRYTNEWQMDPVYGKLLVRARELL